MVDVMVLLKALSMMGKQYYIFNTILEFSTEFQIWNSVGVLPSAEDEVWSMLLAFIHLLEEGLFYGRKVWLGTFREVLVIISVDIIKIAVEYRKGKTRVLQCDGARGVNCTGSNYIPEENMASVRW